MSEKGDVYIAHEAVEDDHWLACQPSAGHEIVINNIYHQDDIELERFDGSNVISFDPRSGAGALVQQSFRCTNTEYLRVKNVSGETKRIMADGAYTKVPE